MSYLSQKLQQVLAQLKVDSNTPLPLMAGRRPGPTKPKHGIPPVSCQQKVLFRSDYPLIYPLTPTC